MEKKKKSLEGPPIPELLDQLEHGDYQRIANLTRKANGEPYTADYVRKVLLGLRINKSILKKAKAYLNKKRKMTETLTS